MAVGHFRAQAHRRPADVVMILVVTNIAFLIHVYSTGTWRRRSGYARYFSYLNLFTGFMLILVLASNILLMFVGLGRRRPLLVPAHRLLVREAGERVGRHEGVRREPHRRPRVHARRAHAARLPGPQLRRLDDRLRADEAGHHRPARTRSRPRWRPSSASCSSSARPARARRSRSTSGCRTRWRARRRCRPSSTRPRWSRRAST